MNQDSFCTTDWNVVMNVQGRERESALALLCQRYWGPLYVFVRRSGQPDQDARDTTQAFFAWLLEKDLFRLAAPERGRLRTFLLTSLSNFLRNQVRDAGRLKRGGNFRAILFDSSHEFAAIEYLADNHLAPDQAFDRAWALLLLDRVMVQLRLEMTTPDQVERFDQLKPILTLADDAPRYEEVSAKLGMSKPAVRKLVSRLRLRFKELVIAEIGSTLADSDDIEDEIRGLFRALTPPSSSL